MSDAFLSCRVFGLPAYAPEAHLDIARKWSGQQGLEMRPDGRIYWGDRTTINTVGDRWSQSNSPTVITLNNGLVPLGDIGKARFFAFVCALPAISATFKRAASSYLHSYDRDAHVSTVTVDLTRLISEKWYYLRSMVRAYDGQDYKNEFVSYRAIDQLVTDGDVTGSIQTSELQKPELKVLHSIELNNASRIIRLDEELNMRVADVSSEFDQVASSLVETFGIVRDYLQAVPLPVPSYT